MRTNQKIYHRLDYTPYPYRLPSTSLEFNLAHERTEVMVEVSFEALTKEPQPMVLDGENITRIVIRLDGETLSPQAYQVDAEKLIIFQPPVKGCLRIVTAIHPSKNTSLLGLFSAEDDLLTKCEAEGFRRITYFADRPDVLSVYSVKLRGCSRLA